MVVRDTTGLVNGPHQAAAPSVTANVEATNRGFLSAEVGTVNDPKLQ